MAKWEEPKKEYKSFRTSIVEKVIEDFWKTHTKIEEVYWIHAASYEDYDPEYGSSSIIPEQKLYGPYETKEEAEKHISLMSKFIFKNGFIVRKYTLVEKVETKRYWIYD